ncbi:MAG: gliding motility lipoprotein GldH [Prevotella sp.]|nr:gliding motility lipoprotein GldH [Prevotella sp.]
MSLRNSWTAVVLGLTIMVLTGCRQKAAFSHYESVSLDGWGREDTIRFALGPVDKESSFCEMLGVRANLDFPFTNVSLVVEQEAMPSGTVRCDTLDIPLINEDGIPLGKGVSRFQYDIPLNTITLLTGETLFVSIRHNMKREYLTGISDVGLTLMAE